MANCVGRQAVHLGAICRIVWDTTVQLLILRVPKKSGANNLSLDIAAELRESICNDDRALTGVLLALKTCSRSHSTRFLPITSGHNGCVAAFAAGDLEQSFRFVNGTGVGSLWKKVRDKIGVVGATNTLDPDARNCNLHRLGKNRSSGNTLRKSDLYSVVTWWKLWTYYISGLSGATGIDQDGFGALGRVSIFKIGACD